MDQPATQDSATISGKNASMKENLFKKHSPAAFLLRASLKPTFIIKTD
jgi:hypothetical protein